ncbi:MAG: hypothetical protein WAJ86_05100 [Candidatus Acidiferrales bacterium]
MHIAIASTVLLLLSPAFPFAQSQSQSKSTTKAHVDLLGMTCAQVLRMTSSEWIAKVTSMDDSREDGELRGIAGYGKCYDERTDRLAALLTRTRKGPSVRARGSFRDLEVALDDFTAEALVDSQPPGDAVKKAYAALYEKAFRYEFYEGYGPKPSVPAQAAVAAAESSPAPKSAAATDANAPASDGAKAVAAPVSEMTRAKNRFGALLDAMPPDKLHEIHAAFGKIVDVQPIASDHELEIYRYAIFVLEPPAPPGAAAPPHAAKPFAPPPF